MKFEKLLNAKEYFHLAFLFGFFVSSAFVFDMEFASQRALSILIVSLVGALYFFRSDPTKITYFQFTDEKKTTNYEIVGPFGMVLFACWLAFVDYKTPEVISKYTGLLIFFTIVNAFAVHSELKERGKTRFVTDNVIIAHKIILWLFFAFLYLIATRYFLAYGSWDWDIPAIDELFRQAFGDD